jgi:purine-cytosine permease-like protein
MKKLTVLLAVVLMMGSNSAFAAPMNSGKGAAASSNTESDDFAWVVGLGALAVLATVVGITAASASSTPSTFGH